MGTSAAERAHARPGRRARRRLAGDGQALGQGGARAPVRRRAGRRPPRRRCGSSRACASAGTRSSRSARPARAGAWRWATSTNCLPLRRSPHARGRPRAPRGLEAGADRTHRRRDGPRACSRSRRSPRRTCRCCKYVRRDPRGGPARGGADADRARLRAGDGADRRRRGAAVPPVRARAADARGRPRASRSPSRWRASRARCCRSPCR